LKAENIVAVILIAGAGSIVTYFVISNWWAQTHPVITHGISCGSELKEFQYNLELSKRQQVESLVMADPALKKLIDESSYCEFMGLGTLYTGNGSYQILNINLNDTNELTAEVSLQNNSVVSYDLNRLTRTYGPISVQPVDIVLSYLFLGAISAGITVYLFKVRKRK